MAKRPDILMGPLSFWGRAGCQSGRFEHAGLSVIGPLVVVASLVTTIPLAWVNPVEPTWIAGMYDSGGYDEVVGFLAETGSTIDASLQSELEQLMVVAKVAQHDSGATAIAIPFAIRLRSPPHDTTDGSFAPLTARRADGGSGHLHKRRKKCGP